MAIPIGLVGGGKHGSRYLRHLLEDVPEFSLKLLCRRDADAGSAQAAAAGAGFVADWRRLVASPEIEAVVVVVPPSLHVEICAAAASEGKAILVEKPLATTVAGARAIRDAVERFRIPCLVAHTLRFNQVVRALRREIESLGTLHQIVLSQRFEPSPLEWLDAPELSGGGILLHTGVHSFDLVRHLSGRDPTSAFSVAGRVSTRQTEDNFGALLAFGEMPLTALIAGSRSTRSRNGTIEISGERGQLLGDHHYGTLVRVEGGDRVPIDTGPPVPTVRETLRAFATSVRDGDPPAVGVADGLWSVATAEACYRSIASGIPERVLP